MLCIIRRNVPFVYCELFLRKYRLLYSTCVERIFPFRFRFVLKHSGKSEFFVDILFRYGPPEDDSQSGDDQPLFALSVRGREDFYVPLRGLQVTSLHAVSC